MKFRMMLSALLLAVGLLFVTGCKKSPTEVAKKSLEAMKKQDFDTIIALCDGKQQEEAKIGAKVMKEMKEKADKGDANAKQALESIQKMTYEIKGEKIEGDFAEVEVAMTMNGKTKTEKMHFKKVNGEWKFIADDDYKPAK